MSKDTVVKNLNDAIKWLEANVCAANKDAADHIAHALHSITGIIHPIHQPTITDTALNAPAAK
ncbi:MAG: hypothetical protein KGJ13_02165 [Patescibacteria group bacterium]|nr:hypothetical protein [Patescibacteria group bacterium]